MALAATGTRKLRRNVTDAVSTCPFSCGRRTRQKWEAKQKCGLQPEEFRGQVAVIGPVNLATEILVLS